METHNSPCDAPRRDGPRRGRRRRRPAERDLTGFPFRLAALALGVCLSSGVLAEDPRPPEPSATDVRALGAPSYARRVEATERLLQGGAAVIPRLIAAYPQSDLETRTRIVYVLQQMALSDDPKLEDAARSALEKLSAFRQTAAIAPKQVLATLDTVREERALAFLIEHGAAFESGPANLPVREPVLTIDSRRWNGSVKGLERLAHIHKRHAVHLVGPRVTDAWLAHVARMPGLQVLILTETDSVTAAGIKGLAHAKGLRDLSIYYANIEGDLAGAIETFADSLVNLRLYGTGLTQEAAVKLRAVLPVNTAFDFRRGAFLGVQCTPEVPCRVGSVVEGSAAQKAGLRSGDVLIAFDGKPVRSFDDLRNQIARFRAGDQATVVILRSAREIRLFLDRPRDEAALGMEVAPHPLGWRVTKVTSGKEAAHQGIRAGDIVYEVGGSPPPPSVAKLVKHLHQNHGRPRVVPQKPARMGPGMGIGPVPVVFPNELKALRGGTEHTLKVKFGRWIQSG